MKYIVSTSLVFGFVVALLTAVPVVSQEPMPVIPESPKVPNKLDLPLKNFTQELPKLEVKFDMVYVPGGEFLMGSPANEAGREANEGPLHKVQVKPFWLAKYEVTWNEYYAFWQDERLYKTGEVPEAEALKLKADAITRPTNAYVPELYDMGKDGHPAVCMSHHSAMMYCHWLRWQTKRGYRLPTEAEWEYACRAGFDGPYGFDSNSDKLGDYAWYKANSASKDHVDAADEKAEDQGRTHKVGTKKANKFGVHDLHGNVAEWVLDHWDDKFYAKFPTDKLTLGPVNVPTDRKWGHVVRGGSWADTAERLRSAARRGSDRTWMRHDPQIPRSIWWLTKMDVIGFRVALPVEEYPDLVGLKPMVEKKVD
jgi:formylglycine-generating enzyme required for sulfatase activity